MAPESLDQAIRHFEEALKYDADLAEAYVGLADAFGIKAYLYDDPRRFAQKQEEALRAALERDPSNGLAHAMFGEQRRYHHWDWPGAEAAFTRAIELAPGDPRVRRCYWAFLLSIGRYREASVQLEVAGRLDPFSPAIPWDRGFQAAVQGDYSKALLEAKRSLEIDPGYVWSHALIWFLGQEGVVTPLERDAAMAEFLRELGYAELAVKFDEASPPGNEANRLLETARRLEEISRERRVPVGVLGMLFAAAGDLESAERVIVRAYEDRNPELVWLGQDPSYRELRRRPAIQELLRELKLVPAQHSVPQ
jgi:tetratricopeptide (TPR) repeat protein